MFNAVFNEYNKVVRDNEYGCLGAILLLLVAIGLIIGCWAFCGWLYMIVWNLALIPLLAVFGVALPKLGFWAGLGLFFLIHLLGKIFSHNTTVNNK